MSFSDGLLTSKELDQRLDRWASWARGPSVGSTSGAVGYMRERLDRAADSAEMTKEIEITEQAIARTKMEDKAYWRVIARYYLDHLSFVEISMQFRASEHGIKRLLLQAKTRIGEHIFSLERGLDSQSLKIQNR